MASCLLISPGLHSTSAQQEIRLVIEAQRQIEAILDEKSRAYPAQRKIESRLLYAIKERRGEALTNHEEVRSPHSARTAQSDEKGRVEVEIKGNVNKELIVLIEKLGAVLLRFKHPAWRRALDRFLQTGQPARGLQRAEWKRDVGFEYLRPRHWLHWQPTRVFIGLFNLLVRHALDDNDRV